MLLCVAFPTTKRFEHLESPCHAKKHLPQRNGINISACALIVSYLATSNSLIELLYIANNLIKDQGLEILFAALETNSSMVRPAILSCGSKNKGTIVLVNALMLVNALTRHSRCR